MVVRNDDRASQILVLPATASVAASQQARGLVEAVIGQDGASDANASSSSSRILPWHIANRYYEADVHFRIADVSLLPPASSQKTSRAGRLQPRGARLVEGTADAEKDRFGPTTTEDDAALAARVRNVFEALEQGSAASSSRHTTQAQESVQTHRKALASRLAGVQAVMILVDRDQSVEQHRKLIALLSEEDEEEEALLSGFNLAVSMIVAVPTLRNAGEVTASTAQEGVDGIYAGEGWEYVDLAQDNAESLDHASLSNGADEELGNVPETEGIDRIREALMTHTWPGLVQASGRQRHAQAQRIEIEEVDEVTGALAQVRLDLDKADVIAGAAQPTQRDEELAAAFLARINAASLKDDGENFIEKQIQPGQSQSEMQAALERFLEEEDGAWPQGSSGTGSSLQAAAVWPAQAESREIAPGASAHFDDDFTDFAAAPANGAVGADDDDLFQDEKRLTHFDNFIDKDMLDADDAILARALAQEQETDGNDAHVDFEATLSAVMAQAERVRSIPDHDKRREEAARVALALLDQQ